jgi:hypothetical protein
MSTISDHADLARQIYSEAIQVQWDTTRELLTSLDPETLTELRVMAGLGDKELQGDDYDQVLDDLTQKIFLSDRLTCFPKFMETVNLVSKLHQGGDMR